MFVHEAMKTASACRHQHVVKRAISVEIQRCGAAWMLLALDDDKVLIEEFAGFHRRRHHALRAQQQIDFATFEPGRHRRLVGDDKRDPHARSRQRRELLHQSLAEHGGGIVVRGDHKTAVVRVRVEGGLVAHDRFEIIQCRMQRLHQLARPRAARHAAAGLGGNQQRIAEDLPQPRKPRRYSGLRQMQPKRRARDVGFGEQRIDVASQ